MTEATETPAKDENIVLTDAERQAAEKAGVAENVKEAAKVEAAQSEDGASIHHDKTSKPTGKDRFPHMANVMQIAHLADGSLDSLKAALDPKLERPLTESQVAGLLEVERSGKNRTDYVKLLMDRLGVDSPYEVTNAGPAFTNDTTATTDL